jgi:hypothetical protein
LSGSGAKHGHWIAHSLGRSLIEKLDHKPIESVGLLNLRPVPAAPENMQLRAVDEFG